MNYEGEFLKKIMEKNNKIKEKKKSRTNNNQINEAFHFSIEAYDVNLISDGFGLLNI